MTFLKQILRIPGRTIDPNALTGVGPIDEYLIELDSKLLGNRKVRLPRILEIKSHLLELMDGFTESGMSTDEAAKKAVQSVDHPHTFAKIFNKALNIKFMKMSLYFGIFMTAFKYLFTDHVIPAGFDPTIFNIIFETIFVGIWMGLFSTYYFSIGYDNHTPSKNTEFPIRVGYSIGNKVGSFMLGGIFLALGILIVLVNIDIIEMSSIIPGIPSLLLFILLVPLSKLLLFDSTRTIEIHEDKFIISGWFIRNQTINLDLIINVRPSKYFVWPIPSFGNHKLNRDIVYKDNKGKEKFIKIDKSMDFPNATRFILMAEKAVKEKKSLSF